MTIRNELGVLAVSMLLAGGCAVDGDASVENLQQNGICCLYGQPNGTGINIAENPTGPANYFGIFLQGYTQWYATGFTNVTAANGTQSVTVVGWTNNSSTTTASPLNGLVIGAKRGGSSYTIFSITGGGSDDLGSNPTSLIIRGKDNVTGRGAIFYGSGLNGLTLTVKVDIRALATSQSYDILFSTPQVLANQTPSGDGQHVYGQLLSTRRSDSLDAYQPWCKLAGNINEPAIAYDGSAFHPMTAARTDSDSSVTLTCQSGGIAKAMLWGYTTWDSSGTLDPTLQDYHQSAIQLKRAAYNGDGQAFTISGTAILKRDQLLIWKDDVSLQIEALWDQNGALCVTDKNRRHPELSWSNPKGLKECDSNSMANLKWLTASASIP